VLHVTVPNPVRGPRVNGIVSHQRQRFDSVHRGRLRVIAPAEVWCDLGELLTEHDLIAVGDFLVTGNPYEKVLPLTTIQELRVAISRRRGAPGVRACARAVAKVALEYEGDHHRGVRQFRDDIRRIERLADNGWLVIKVSADDVFDRPRELVDRVVRRLASRGLSARGIRLPLDGVFVR